MTLHWARLGFVIALIAVAIVAVSACARWDDYYRDLPEKTQFYVAVSGTLLGIFGILALILLLPS